MYFCRLLINVLNMLIKCNYSYHVYCSSIFLHIVLQAMVKFENPPRNKLVLVECRAYAQNIEHDITAKLGLVNFELLVEDIDPTTPVESR